LSCTRAPSSTSAFGSKVSSPRRRCSQCTEYSSRISDLETRLTLTKRQAQMTIDKASDGAVMMVPESLLAFVDEVK
jgi:hypothetical protein